MDDQISGISVDGPSVLKVVCSPPGIGAETSRKFLEKDSNFLH
jgi:hypothetical protein